MNDIFEHVAVISYNTRNSFLRLKQPFRKTSQGQNCLSYVGPSVWNKMPQEVKNSENINTFKHNIKKYFLQKYRNK